MTFCGPNQLDEGIRLNVIFQTHLQLSLIPVSAIQSGFARGLNGLFDFLFESLLDDHKLVGRIEYPWTILLMTVLHL